MACVEAIDGLSEEYVIKKTGASPPRKELTQRGAFIHTGLGGLYVAEREDKVYMSWGGLKDIMVVRTDGSLIHESHKTNFINLRENGNREVIVSQLGATVPPVLVRLIDDESSSFVGAKNIPPKPHFSASAELSLAGNSEH